MEGVSVIEHLEGNDGDYDKEESIDKDKVEKVLANYKDRVNYNTHLFIAIAKYGKYLHDGHSPKEVSHDDISIWYERSQNNEGNNKTNNIAS